MGILHSVGDAKGALPPVRRRNVPSLKEEHSFDVEPEKLAIDMHKSVDRYSYIVSPSKRPKEKVIVDVDFSGQLFSGVEVSVESVGSVDGYRFPPTKGDLQHALASIRSSVDAEGNLNITDSNTGLRRSVDSKSIIDAIVEQLKIFGLSHHSR